MSKRPYSVDTLKLAVSAVKQKRLTITQASREYGVPRKTVDNHARGIIKRHTFGPARMLEEEEEQALVRYLEYMAGQGFPMTRAMIRTYVVELVRHRETLFNMDSGPSDKWFRSFFARHPELTERVPERYDRARARMSNQVVMDQYFDLLEKTIDRLGIAGKPERLFNADETGWSGKEKGHKKVVGVKGQHIYQQSCVPSGHITAHICVSGDGRVLPTFLIFEKSLPHTTYKEDVPGNWMYGSSDSGYMDSELFKRWFENIFLSHCGRERPVLLIMDNHDSHINVEIVKIARENNVELLGLPAHTTHILQPLDVSINGPIKAKFATMAARLGFLSKNTVINKAKFPAILSNTIDNVCSPAVVKGAFRKCGIVPLNRNAIDKTQLTKSHIQPKEPTKESSKDGTTCSACGTFFGVNPLVKEGLIPEKLSQLFPPVPAKLKVLGESLF